MRRLALSAAIALTGLGFVSAAFAQTATCPADPVLPSEYSAWAEPSDVMAATNPANAPFIETELAYKVALVPMAQVTTASPLPKTPAADTFGGLMSLTIQDAGTYAVAAGSGVWIDLVSGKTALTSTNHGHGPNCSGIRKIVNFKLEPGNYLLQLTGSRDPKVTVMVRPVS